MPINLSCSVDAIDTTQLNMHRGGGGKGKGLDTCYSATYMSQTRDQQRFTISEVAAD